MKMHVCLMLAVVFAGGVQAQDLHDWKVNLRITDEAGQPIKAAQATVFYDPMTPPDKSIDPGNITGLTDSNGVFAASHRDRTYGLRFLVEKDGYYATDIQDDFHRVFSPENLNQNLNLNLKKVGKPIAMYAKRNTLGLTVPENGKPIAYDLEIGDWVGPHGKGIHADIVFQADDEVKSNRDYKHNVTVTFLKDGDGIQVFVVPDSDKGSGLRSPHEAPIDGYQSELTRETYAHPGQPSKFENDPNRIYLFRVRTAKDHEGNIVSAHYGKIYGDFMQFTYYLNPTPNDRNIEFDPKQNLLQGLQSFEQVTTP